jgi:precorrin-2 dehydrogenase / sirohydrochlorin ferrochelatase
MTTYYMAALNLEGRRVLVVGAGRIALEKINGVLVCGADVHVVAPVVEGEVDSLEREGRVHIRRRTFQESDVDGAFLVIAATNDMGVNTSVFEAAERRSIPVNVVDVPPLCSFILPAVERNGPLAVAISTGGASPALAKRMKREIADKVGDEYVTLAELLEAERSWAKSNLATYDDRKDFFEEIVNGDPDPIELLRRGDIDAVRAIIDRAKRASTLPASV